MPTYSARLQSSILLDILFYILQQYKLLSRILRQLDVEMTTPLKTIPSEDGLPLFGHALHFMRNCNELLESMVAKHGPIYANRYLKVKSIHLLSPEGNEFILLDREKNFSSKQAWNHSLKNLFPNGLMLRDGDEHRHHRRLLGAPFKAKALEIYVDNMNPDVAGVIASWGLQKDFRFYRAIKDLTLNLAANVFVGESLNEEADNVNKAFVDLVEASMVIVRYPMLGNKYQRGLKARAYLEEYFGSRIAAKQASNDTDMFAQICRAESEDGTGFTKQDIIDHIIFLMMAAHDTTTSALSSVCYALSQSPEWQDNIRSEINTIDGKRISYEQMPQLPSVDLVLKEALRLYPPLPIVPRTAIKDCEFQGYAIAKGDGVIASPYYTQRLPEIWSEPNRFDPERFNKERAEHRKHKHAWIPFGGGAHKCLGLNFAELQIKLVLFHLLKNYQISVRDGYKMPYQPAPIGKPTDLLPLTLTVI